MDTLEDGVFQNGRNRRLDSESNNGISLIRMRSNFMRLTKLQSEDAQFGKTKEGKLTKKGGLHGTKSEKERWVSFRENNLSYAKDETSPPIKTIPLSRIKDVEIADSTNRPTFHVITPDRTYIFMSSKNSLDEIIIWAQVLAEAIIFKNKNGLDQDDIGGRMANPDKEGWLCYKGNERYVAIKADSLCYYQNFEAFKHDLPTTSLTMELVRLEAVEEKLKLDLTTNDAKKYNFKAKDQASFRSWKTAIEDSIQFAHGDTQFLEKIQENASNKRCADCGATNPIYASINLMVVVCSHCIGWHRNMGVNHSKTKSILMDVEIWTPSLIKLFQIIGNEKANQLWNEQLSSDDVIGPECSPERRKEHIFNKYMYKKYVNNSLASQNSNIEEMLRENVLTDNLLKTFHLLISNVNVTFIPKDCELSQQKSTYQIAEEAGKELQMELLRLYNGHKCFDEIDKITQNEAKFIPTDADKETNNLKKELQQELKTKFIEEKSGEDDQMKKTARDFGKDNENLEDEEKYGLLKLKANDNDQWIERLCYLKGKQLTFKGSSIKSRNDIVCSSIDIRKIELLGFKQGDIYIKLPKCTYMIRASTLPETVLWYQALRRKQVFGVPIELQACGKCGIPYLIEKCIEYVEQYGLTEQGIYRIGGNLNAVAKLILEFNQDAENIRINPNNYSEVAIVATVFKRYLRELPRAVIPPTLYNDFISVSVEGDTKKRTADYKCLLQRLPGVNYESLRAIIIHLNDVNNLSDINNMGLKNIKLLFGPILMSGSSKVESSDLEHEYRVFDHLFTSYEEIFDVSEKEMKAIDGKVKTLRQMHRLNSKSSVNDSNEIQITVFVIDKNENENEDQMKMNDTTKPIDVAKYFMDKYGLQGPPNKWALFQVYIERNVAHERLVESNVCIKELISTQITESRLVLKINYLAEILAGFDGLLSAEGILLCSAVPEKPKKKHVEVNIGNVKIYKTKGGACSEDIAVHQIQLYVCGKHISNEDIKSKQKSNSLPKFGFALKLANNQLRYFFCDDEELYKMFITAILNLKYPNGLMESRRKSEVQYISKRESFYNNVG